MFKELFHNRILIGVFLFALVSSVFMVTYAYQLPLEKVQESVLYEYASKGVFDYIVVLYPNILYEGNTLTNPDKVFLKLVDKITVNVVYVFSAQPSIIDVNNTLDVEVLLSHPQAWSRRINYTSIVSRENAVRHVVELDVPRILSFAKNISQTVDLPSSKYTITVNCAAKTVFTIANATKVVNFPFSLQIDLDLAGKVVEFSQREFSNISVQKRTETREVAISLGFVDVSTRLLRQVSLVLLVTTSTVTATLAGVNFIRFYKSKDGALRLLRKYKSLIVETSEIAGDAPSKVVRVKSLDELAKISESVVKPIVYLKTGSKHLFYVLDENVAYIYEYEEES